jgi:transposase
MKHLDARLLPPVTQQQIRHKAVELFLNGKNPTDISKHLGVSRQAVYTWIKKHSESGNQGLKIHKRGRPKGTQLQPWQSSQIVNLIKNSCPDELSLPFFLWTRESVGLLIRNKFNINLSKWTVGRYLANWGFSPQKPIRRAIEQDPKAIERWFMIEYPSIQKLSKKEKATIYCGDEMGLRSDHNVGRTYGLKGKTPVVRRTGNRFSCNMISSITNLGKLNFMVFYENFTSEIFLIFLKKLIRQSNRKVFLIVDNHRAHKSKMIKNWLINNEKHIRLYYLPSYCPELNPDEFLNQDVKSHLGKQCLQNKTEMIKTLNSHLKMRQKQPQVIQNFIKGCHLKYSA